MEISDEYLNIILKNVDNKSGSRKWKLKRKQTEDDILNYLGAMVLVTVIDELNNDTLDLVVKRAPDVLCFKEVLSHCYGRETYFYTKLLPIFKSLNTNIGPNTLIPELYYANFSSEDKVLVLQNMNVLGFKRFNREMLDVDHIKVALKSIAKFHALSFIMKERNIELPNNNSLRPFLCNSQDYYYKTLKFSLFKYSTLFVGSVHDDYFQKLKTNFDCYFDSTLHKVRQTVYVHGDCWKENILFKYNGETPVEACLVDYQLTRILTPAYDVLFLLMTAVDDSTRRQHFQSLFYTYYAFLSETLVSNGVNPRTFYTVEDFFYDLKCIFPLCFIRTFFSHLLWLGVEEDTKLVTRANGMLVKIDVAKEITFKKIIVDLITGFTNLGYIA